MTILEVARALGPIDVKSVRRDPLLRWLAFYPLVLSLLIRWSTPILRTYFIARFHVDVQPYYPLLMSFVMLMTPMLAGMVVGFLLLDQRDDQTLTALQVTPLTLSGYFAYRIAVPTGLSFAITIAVFPVAGLMESGPLGLVGAGLSCCLLAPIYALFLGVFAKNKVQGFALTKAAGIVVVPPLIAYFVQSRWQLLFGLDPLYWPAKFLWIMKEDGRAASMYLTAGVFFQWALLRFLMRRMNH